MIDKIKAFYKCALYSATEIHNCLTALLICSAIFGFIGLVIKGLLGMAIGILLTVISTFIVVTIIALLAGNYLESYKDILSNTSKHLYDWLSSDHKEDSKG